MNIYIVRHAESSNNTDGRFCTYTDGDLTAKGELQAEYCRRALEDVAFDKVYSSDLIRAIKTAQIVSQEEHIIEFSELGEMHGGDYEGKTWEELDQIHPHLSVKLINSFSNKEFPGGESYEGVKNRLIKFINQELTNPDLKEDSNILIVSHGMTLRILINVLMGQEDEGVNQLHWADNTAITHIEWGKQKKLHSLLSNQHLIDNGMDRSNYKLWWGKEHVNNEKAY